MTPITAEGMILEALLSRLKALVLTPALPVEWPDQPFDVPDDRRYLRVQLLPNEPARVTIDSDGPMRHMGILQLTHVWPVAKGQIAAREEAGLVADWFSADTHIAFGTILVRPTKRPTVAMSMPDGADLLTPISVNYESYI